MASRPLSDYVDRCLGPALARQGFAAADIIAAWPDIVGERLGRFSQPVRIEWPRRAGAARDERSEPAALVIRVEGAFALEIQHLAPLIAERINARYGWRCIGRIVLKQGSVRRLPRPQPSMRPVAREDAAAIATAIEAVAEPGLRDALGRLGSTVFAHSPGRPRLGGASCHNPSEVLPHEAPGPR